MNNAMQAEFQKLFKPSAGESPATAATVKSLAGLLSNGGVAVIVGGRSSNWSPQQRKHPRFVFFDTEEQTRHGSLPTNARAVYFTRFLSHAWEKKLRGEAKDRGIYNPPGLWNTGDIRTVLDDFIEADHEAARKVVAAPVIAPTVVKTASIMPVPTVVAPPAPEPPAPPVEEPELRSVRRGELKDFVIANGDPYADIQTESERIVQVLHNAGIETTTGSVYQALRSYRPEMLKRVRNSPQEVASLGVAVVVKPVVESPPASPTRRKSAMALLEDSLAEAERVLSEVRAAADTVRAAADVIGEMLPRLRSEVEAFKAQQRAVRELANKASEFLD